MRLSRGPLIGALALTAVLVAGLLIAIVKSGNSYKVEILMPSAAGTFEGDGVKIGGQAAGTIDKIGVRNNKALVTVALEDGFAPLHDGTTARISWEAVLDERFLEVLPGPLTNPVIRSGSRIESHNERVELDDVLAMLDPGTISNSNSLIQQVQQILHGREKSLQNTLQNAGPAVNAAGEVLQAVGSDGPAIRDLVTQLHEVTKTLAQRDQKVAGTVDNLGKVTLATAAQQGQLSRGLSELPSTLSAAKGTLERVPAAVDQTVPLLKDLHPATAQLPSVAGNLNPVLKQLRPTVQQLRPTIDSAQTLLKHTPGLLDSAHGTLPDATDIVARAQPAVDFLRPYTPELAGWISNWTGVFAGKDATGNYARPLITASASSVADNPGIMPPGQRRDARPPPGAIAGQPWTDANGDGAR